MSNEIILQSIALDLKRAALGYHAGSVRMADRFLEEAYKRKQQLIIPSLPSQVKSMLKKIDRIAIETNREKQADDALMYSTLFLLYAKRIG